MQIKMNFKNDQTQRLSHRAGGEKEKAKKTTNNVVLHYVCPPTRCSMSSKVDRSPRTLIIFINEVLSLPYKATHSSARFIFRPKKTEKKKRTPPLTIKTSYQHHKHFTWQYDNQNKHVLVPGTHSKAMTVEALFH